jgi:hypothetical protein
MSTGHTGMWRPIDTADVNHLFASSTWVLVYTSAGMVVEATPHYFGPGAYIWMTARGENCRGSDDERGQMLRTTVSHWMPLPDPPKAPTHDAPRCAHGATEDESCPECLGAPSDDPDDEVRAYQSDEEKSL